MPSDPPQLLLYLRYGQENEEDVIVLFPTYEEARRAAQALHMWLISHVKRPGELFELTRMSTEVSNVRTGRYVRASCLAMMPWLEGYPEYTSDNARVFLFGEDAEIPKRLHPWTAP